MKNWYDWQDRNQFSETTDTNWIVGNLKNEIKIINQWLKVGSAVTVEGPSFDRTEYLKEVVKNYQHFELSESTLTDWIMDPAYTRFFDVVSKHDTVSDIPEPVKKTFIKHVKDFFPVDWTQHVHIKITIQQPGHMFPLHYDRIKNDKFSLDSGEEGQLKRWLIMLEDQQPGQAFFMNTEYLHWKAGDVVSWDHLSVPHGSANFGYHPRPMLLLTGIQKN